ncbi:hypothetical protein Y032_1153g3699, partial [Ancylostoma ceylanicum]
FCAEFPPALIEDKKLGESEFPLRISHNTCIHQGTNIRDNRARVIKKQREASIFWIDYTSAARKTTEFSQYTLHYTQSDSLIVFLSLHHLFCSRPSASFYDPLRNVRNGPRLLEFPTPTVT